MALSKENLKAASYILMFLFIAMLIPLHLFPCFISGFLAYEVVISLTPSFERFFGNGRGRWISVTIIAIFVIITIILSIVGLVNLLTSDLKKGIDLTVEINRVFYHLKKSVPIFFPSFLPESVKELKDQIFLIIESNLAIIRNMGRTFLHGLITILIGIIIGSSISLNKTSICNSYFINQILKRIQNLSIAFHNIIFAQIKVSLVNTILTAIMILMLLPLCGVHLPMSKILIVSTFLFGLIPIIGNLISNFMIIISALSVSLTMGGAIFVYLILIHKLEYFLNAEIIGSRIKAKSWELLLAMLIFEAAFGIEGLIAAPIYYAYLKTELRAQKLI